MKTYKVILATEFFDAIEIECMLCHTDIRYNKTTLRAIIKELRIFEDITEKFAKTLLKRVDKLQRGVYVIDDREWR